MPRSSTSLTWLCILWSSGLAVAQSPPPPDIVHIPLTASSDNQRYFANVNMSFGDQTQRFGFALSTTTGYTVVANTACTTCASNNIPTYNASQSNSAKSIASGQQQQSVTIAGGVANVGAGFLSKESCALHQANGSFWQYPNQTIVQANASAAFQEGISGLIGLGTNAADFSDTILGPWLNRNPAQHNVSFGLALNPIFGTQGQTSPSGDQDDASASAGTLHMLQPDPKSYEGDIAWQSVQSTAPIGGNSDPTGTPGSNLSGSSWLIQMDGWNFTAGGAQTSNREGGLAAVEPFFANIFLPRAQAKQLYASLPGAQVLPTASGATGESYSVPCDTDITFSVVLSGQEYDIPTEALVVQTGGLCTGAIEGWANDDATNYLLGSRFISTVYMVFQVSRPPNMQQQVGLARRTKGARSKPPVGSIVGGVVGGVAFLVLVGGALFWWIRRRQRQSSASVAAVHRGGLDGTEKFDEKVPGSSNTADGFTIDHWAPSSVPHTPSGATFSQSHASQTNTSPDPYYTTVGSPSSAAFSHPVSPATNENSFPGTHTPPGTATSETGFLIPGSPKVNQWVTGLQPTSDSLPARSVPTQYDYGNRGEPGQLSPFPETSETAPARSRDSYASSTLAAPSESWKPEPLRAP